MAKTIKNKESIKKTKKAIVKKKQPAKKAVTKKTVKKTKKIKKVPAIAKGYHSITPYLIVDNATNAIEFYKSAFGAKEVLRISKTDGKIGHAELQIGTSKFMLADEYPELNARSAKNIGASPVSIYLYIKDVDAIIDRAILLGATLIRAVETMYYGDRSGGILDPFGHVWFIATHVEDVTPAEIKKRMAKLAHYA